MALVVLMVLKRIMVMVRYSLDILPPFLPQVAAEPSALSGSPPHVVSPHQLTNSLSTASFKLGADSEGSDIGVDHSLDNTLQHLVQAHEHQNGDPLSTPGPARRNTARRRSKPYDSSSVEDQPSTNGKPSKSAAAMARLAEGATKAMEELEDELAVKRRRNTGMSPRRI